MKEDQERTPLRTILQNFLNHIESLEIQRAEDSYEKEFQELKFFSEILKTSKQYSCSEGEKEVNRKKNRYKDILPFDNSRVILSEYAGVPGSDYINANYIKGASGSPAYIACQGPLPHTVNDFWRMVVECEVQVIVMACNEEEAGKHKCENYWVEREGEEKQFGMVAIRLVKASTVCPDFLVRTMRLKYTTSQSPHEERTICQFHYSAWPDHGVPPLVRPLLDMVRLVRDTQASETLPVLVHCSAGCGRTGTICAIDYVWGLLRAGKLSKDFSLYKLVQDMRKQRIAMVQTKEQYVLVHQAVRELFREQLRMIDSHPYENIDANGMPLMKEDQEPMYASPTISIPLENSNEECSISHKFKKNCITSPQILFLIRPPFFRFDVFLTKKRFHVASSKQEKEVENLTEKQRSIVEQSSASHKPRIAKLKALFERSPAMRESRSSQTKHRSCSQVARSHSLGALRIRAQTQEEPVAPAETNATCSVPSQAAASIPQLSVVQTSRPSLPVKRSKSLKVLGSNQRCKLSLAATISSITTVNTLEDNSDSQGPSSTLVESVPQQRQEYAAYVKPFIPPKKYTAKNREVPVDTGDPRSSQKNADFSKSQKALNWMSCERSHMVPKRRRSLESINFENAALSDESITSPSKKSDSLDDEARRILEDCKDYLVRGVRHERVTQSDSLTLEAQRKINAIIAGLGVRERRNSFRQAVGTSQESETKPDRKFKDYEAIWPCSNAMQTKDKSHVHPLKGKTSTWFPANSTSMAVSNSNVQVQVSLDKNSVQTKEILHKCAAAQIKKPSSSQEMCYGPNAARGPRPFSFPFSVFSRPLLCLEEPPPAPSFGRLHGSMNPMSTKIMPEPADLQLQYHLNDMVCPTGGNSAGPHAMSRSPLTIWNSPTAGIVIVILRVIIKLNSLVDSIKFLFSAYTENMSPCQIFSQMLVSMFITHTSNMSSSCLYSNYFQSLLTFLGMHLHLRPANNTLNSLLQRFQTTSVTIVSELISIVKATDDGDKLRNCSIEEKGYEGMDKNQAHTSKMMILVNPYIKLKIATQQEKDGNWMQAPGVDVDIVAASISPQQGFTSPQLSGSGKKQHYF
ncbi:hypothetical protein L9F63_020843 [Diploptera punctata]|uniref:protein-tyrosine-phosphatase n=1 Tax=Diploptera punctata TaxID=6984 RepID=A0AAD7ZRH6_DIPPU|nr:hypothetical protein L9F63_020843 [Diploptera punctata]